MTRDSDQYNSFIHFIYENKLFIAACKKDRRYVCDSN